MDQEALLVTAEARRLATSGDGARIRQAARLSVAEVAAAVGVDRVTVARWETGERRPTGEPALRYAALIGALARQAEVQA
ncbi:helix-turn-helix domain-containing protein [Nitriliruptor alkaliphilus]|uniref:helix-turn-helix domain-containing protein n=1 Tax=Nitriliruptor alkaliphilus TaxID=427918 RepID=UPI0009FAB65F|nr:helix-turn-helix domain-containing protein [Nitriliruptor alkaliphilus]